MDLPKISVNKQRSMFANDEEFWVCETCGEQNEEGLAVYETTRVTRLYPDGSRVVMLCSVCVEKTSVTRVISS